MSFARPKLSGDPLDLRTDPTLPKPLFYTEMQDIEGRLGLEERRLFNVLLAVSWEDLVQGAGRNEPFSAPAIAIRRAAGQGGQKDNRRLRSALRTLQEAPVRLARGHLERGGERIGREDNDLVAGAQPGSRLDQSAAQEASRDVDQRIGGRARPGGGMYGSGEQGGSETRSLGPEENPRSRSETLLAFACLTEDGRTVEWGFSREMMEVLARPQRFARVRLAICARFRRKYGLALYEALSAYVERDHPVLRAEIGLLQAMMGVRSAGAGPVPFGQFDRRALTAGLEEVKSRVGFRMQVTREIDGPSRRVTAIAIHVSPVEAQPELALDDRRTHRIRTAGRTKKKLVALRLGQKRGSKRDRPATLI